MFSFTKENKCLFIRIFFTYSVGKYLSKAIHLNDPGKEVLYIYNLDKGGLFLKDQLSKFQVEFQIFLVLSSIQVSIPVPYPRSIQGSIQDIFMIHSGPFEYNLDPFITDAS